MPSILAALRLTKVKPVDGSAPSKKKPSSYATVDVIATEDELEIRKHMECQIDSFFGGAPVVKSKPPKPASGPKRYKLDVLPPAYAAPAFNEPLPEYKEPNTCSTANLMSASLHASMAHRDGLPSIKASANGRVGRRQDSARAGEVPGHY